MRVTPPSPFASERLDRESMEAKMADVESLDLPRVADEKLNFITESFEPVDTAVRGFEGKLKEYGRARSDLLLEENGDFIPLERGIRADLQPVKTALQAWKSGVLGIYPKLIKMPVDHIIQVLGRDADPALRTALSELLKQTPDAVLLDRLILVVESDLENLLLKLETQDRTRKPATEGDGGLTDKAEILNQVQIQYFGGANDVHINAQELTRASLTKKVEETEAKERKEKAFDAIPAAAEAFFVSRTTDGPDTIVAALELFKAMRDAVAAAKGLPADDASIPTDDDLTLDSQFTKVSFFSLRADVFISERQEIMPSANFLAGLLGPDNYQTARRMKEEVLARKHQRLSKHFTDVFGALETALNFMDGPELMSAIGLFQRNLTDAQNNYLINEHQKATGQRARAATGLPEEPDEAGTVFQLGEPEADPERTPARGIPALATLEDASAPWALPPAPADLRSEGTPGTVRRWPAPAAPLPLASAPAPVVSIPPAPFLATPRPAPAPAPAPAIPDQDPFGFSVPRGPAPTRVYDSPRVPPRQPISKLSMALGVAALGVVGVGVAGAVRYGLNPERLDADREAIGAWLDNQSMPWPTPASQIQPVPVEAPVARTPWVSLEDPTHYPTFDNSTTEWVADLSKVMGSDASQGAIAIQCIGGENQASATQPVQAKSILPTSHEGINPATGAINWLIDGCQVKGFGSFSVGACVADVCAAKGDGFLAVALTPEVK